MSYGGRLEAFITVPSGVSISVTNNGGGPTTVNITAGSYAPTSLCAHIASALTAQRAPSSGSWSVTLSTGSAGTGQVTIAMSAGTFSITWTSTVLRDLLGFTGNITTQTSSTGANACRGLWLPKCPMMIEGHPASKGTSTDARSTMSPTGKSLTLKGTTKYRRRGLVWSHVANAQYREAAAAVTYSSLEQWITDTQWGDGHAWFTPGSAFQIYWSNNGTDELVGKDLNSGSGPTYGWTAHPAIMSLDLPTVQVGLLTYFRFGIESIVSEG